MRKFLFAIAALGLLGWSAPASAVVGETTVKVADGTTPIPQATVVVTFKNQAGTPIRTVRRTARRATTGKVTIPDNTATVDITVTAANGVRQTRTGIDVALLINRDITINVPGGAPGTPRTSGPIMPPPISGPQGTIIGFGAGGQSTACNNWKTTGLESLGVADPIGDGPEACFSSAFRGSIYVGTSWRVSALWLAGVEADVGLTNRSTSVNGIPGSVGGIPGLTAAAAANDSVTIKKTWDASFRGRFGYFVAPQAVVYGTAGFALQHIDATVNCSAAGACGLALAAFSATASKTLTGWTLGGGVEISLTDRIVARGEYRYADYGTFTSTFGAPTNIAVTSEIDLRTHTALFGVAYKIGESP